MATRHRHFVALQTRGVLALPADVRRKYGLDEPGAQIELIEREDGIIELHPHSAVPADQTWFWAGAWQKGELEASRDIAKGQTERFESDGDLLDAFRSR